MVERNTRASDAPHRRAYLGAYLGKELVRLALPPAPTRRDDWRPALSLYRLYLEDGSDAGEARYNDWLKPGDEIHVHGTNKAVVVDIVPAKEHDEDR
jgi:hypothetical protein